MSDSVNRLFYWAGYADKYGGSVQETQIYGQLTFLLQKSCQVVFLIVVVFYFCYFISICFVISFQPGRWQIKIINLGAINGPVGWNGLTLNLTKSIEVVNPSVGPGTVIKVHEPVGVIAVICPDTSPLLTFVSLVAPAVAR